MTAATKDVIADLKTVDQFISHPVVEDDIIYRGTFVSADASGKLAQPLVAGERFLGLAEEQCNNSGGAASAKRVRLLRYGAITVAISGVVATDLHKAVYASDDQTATLTATGNSYIGQIIDVPAAGYATVWFDAFRSVAGAPGLSALGGTLTGTVTGALADVGGTYSASEVNTNLKEIQTQLNALTALVNARLA